MAFTLVPDRLWNEIKPLLPAEQPKPKGGRPRVDDRACLTGIVYVLRTGMPWRLVPAELGCGSGVTCWRRLRDWQKAGVWPRMHEKLLRRLGRRGWLDASLVVMDSASVRAVLGGRTPARTPRIVRKTAANATC
jgi:transposase